MVQGIEEREEIYEINDKKYKVVTKCKENSETIDKLYDILCNFIISKLEN